MTEELVQGSEAWFAARRGRVTASRVADVVAKTKSGWGASRANYAAELIAERLTGVTAERYSNAAMAWGTEQEPAARAAYEFYQDEEVEEVGFAAHPEIQMAGASPDGLVGNSGLVEIKCPNTAAHISTLLSQKIPEKYITQMMFQMACTGVSWCDYVSFDPRMPADLSMFVKRVARDDAKVAELNSAVVEFLSEVDATIGELTKLMDKPGTLAEEKSVIMG